MYRRYNDRRWSRSDCGFGHSRWAKLAWPVGCILILSGTVMTSHAAARLENRGALAFLTLVHHAAGAAWIGGLPYLPLVAEKRFNQRGSQVPHSQVLSNGDDCCSCPFPCGRGDGVRLCRKPVGSNWDNIWHHVVVEDNTDGVAPHAGRIELENRSSDSCRRLSKPASSQAVC